MSATSRRKRIADQAWHIRNVCPDCVCEILGPLSFFIRKVAGMSCDRHTCIVVFHALAGLTCAISYNLLDTASCQQLAPFRLAERAVDMIRCLAVWMRRRTRDPPMRGNTQPHAWQSRVMSATSRRKKESTSSTAQTQSGHAHWSHTRCSSLEAGRYIAAMHPSRTCQHVRDFPAWMALPKKALCDGRRRLPRVDGACP